MMQFDAGYLHDFKLLKSVICANYLVKKIELQSGITEQAKSFKLEKIKHKRRFCI